MSIEQRLPDDHPIMVAWAEYKATETYANDVRWAVVPEHTEGALWSAFVAAWNRRAPSADARAAAEEMRKACAAVADDMCDPYGADDGYSARAIAAAIRALPLTGDEP